MNTAMKLVTAGAVAVLICSCAKEPADFLLDNPRDTSGTNWHPPKVTAMPDTTVDINDSITVTAAWTDNGSIVRYLWARNGMTYVDSTTTGSLKVAWVFPDTGRKVVRVKARDNDGLISKPDSCVVTVTQSIPVVTAMVDTTVDINDSITITAVGTDNGNVTRYLWARNGTTYLDTTLSGALKVAWPSIGRKVVRVMAIDNDNLLSAPDSCIVQVTQSIPSVTAMNDTTVDINDSITVTAVGTDNGSIVRYLWARNGTTYADTTTADSFRVAWPTTGRRVVRVVAVDNDGLVSAPDSCVVTVTQSPPTVTALDSASVYINDSITITAVGTDNGSVVRYLWAKNGTTYADSTTTGSLKVAWKLPDTGRKVVRVMARDNDGLLSLPDSCVVTVKTGRPRVTAMPDTITVIINDSLTVTAVGSDSNGTIVSYFWAGDGAALPDTTTSDSLHVAWPDTGRKVVRVTVMDDDSLVSTPDSCVVQVTLGIPKVTAKNDTTVLINDSVTITAVGTDNGSIVRYLWAKNGTTYADSTTGGSIKMAWPDTGRKVVRVMARDNDGLLSLPDSCVLRVVKSPPPKVAAMADTAVAVKDSFYIRAAGTDSIRTIVKYLWALDGVNFSDSTDSGRIKTAFNSAGVKTVKVKARNSDTVESDADSVIITVHLYAPKVLAMPDTSVAVSDSFYVRAMGTDTNGTVVKYLWALDGVNFTDSTDSGRIHTAFDTAGAKTVMVKARDNDGFESVSDSMTVFVLDASPLNLSPADSAVLATVQPALRWMPGLGDTSFTVLLDTLPVPLDTAAARITGTSFTPAAPLLMNKTYYWRVIGYHASGEALGQVWSFSTSPWIRRASMKTAKTGMGVAVVNDKIYVIGGAGVAGTLASVEVYDPGTDTWSAEPDMTIARTPAAAAVNGKIYVIGSDTLTTEYDPVAGTWTEKALMPTTRQPYVAVIDSFIYAIGGYNVISGSLSTNEMYDPSSDSWTVKTDMPTARNSTPVAAANGKIYAIGGEYSPSTPYSIVEEYDTASDSWTAKTDMPTARRAAAAAVVNNKIYVIGGQNSSYTNLKTVEEYDPVADTWKTKTDMPTARGYLGVAVINNKIYAIGGGSDSGTPLVTVEEYDPSLDK